MTAGFLNFDLVEDGFWEGVYARAPHRWSGRPNPALVSILSDVFGDDADTGPRGRAVDVGCGEGADAVWLAAHGWDTTGVDVSVTAVDRAKDAADAAGVGDHVTFTADGLEGFPGDATGIGTA